MSIGFDSMYEIVCCNGLTMIGFEISNAREEFVSECLGFLESLIGSFKNHGEFDFLLCHARNDLSDCADVVNEIDLTPFPSVSELFVLIQ